MADVNAPSTGGAGGIFDGAGSIFGASALFGGNPLMSLVVGGLLAGNTKISSSGGTSTSQLNTSGQVIGDGTAQGGSLDGSAISSLPWWVWPVGALVCMAVIKKAA